MCCGAGAGRWTRCVTPNAEGARSETEVERARAAAERDRLALAAAFGAGVDGVLAGRQVDQADRAVGTQAQRRTALAPDVDVDVRQVGAIGPLLDFRIKGAAKALSEAGIAGYEMSYWFAAYLPARTPAPVVKRLNELMVKAVGTEAVKSFFAKSGLEPFTTTPEQLAAEPHIR